MNNKPFIINNQILVNPELGLIEQKVLADEHRAWTFKMKQYEDGVSLETQLIEAYRAVGVTYGSNQPETVYIFRGWLYQ